MTVAVEREPDEVAALDVYSSVVTSVAQRLLPSVSSLRVTVRVPGGRRTSGSGSAVVLTADGYLVTSAHVVERSQGGVVTFGDGRSLDFEVVGADTLSDLAVIRVQRLGERSLEPAELGDADALLV
ncbi:MAG: peptidase S1, partial [Nitriliruptorales bacterium]|nr:peptidase S1 [Nitriliruptorales bacterium]